MSRKWLLVIGIVLAAAALVAGQWLLSRPGSSAKDVDAANQGVLRPFPRMPSPGVPPRKATSPAPAGQSLAPLTDAPGRTISALTLGSLPTGSQYTIRMRPYGMGPSSALGSHVVILVESATPIGNAPAEKRLAKATVLALVDTSHGGSVTRGGAYSATLTWRSDGKRLLAVLSAVSPAR